MMSFSVLYLQIFTIPAIGAGSLQTSYGKEVPMYSPLAQGATLRRKRLLYFTGNPTYGIPKNVCNREFYSICIVCVKKSTI